MTGAPRQADIAADLRRATLPFSVLAILARGPSYGYELIQEISSSIGMETSEGTVYPLLSRLSKQRLIASEWRPSDAGPPRKYYTVTDEGHRALRDFSAAWSEHVSALDTVLGVRR